MKKLLLFCLLFPLSVLSHEWEEIFINAVEDIFYYDKESVKVSGKTKSVLMLMDYGTPYDDGIISTETDVDLNCDEQTADIKMISFYPALMGKGELMGSEAFDVKEYVSIGDYNGLRALLDILCGEGGLTANWIPSFEDADVLKRYIDVYSIRENEDGHINYWILTNYFVEDLDGSVYDLIEIDCKEPQKRLRTNYRRNFSEHNGINEESSYEYINDWIYPPEGSLYMDEIEPICGLFEETEDSVDE